MPVITTLFRFGYFAAAKEVLRWRGVDLGGVRLPNGNLTAEQATALRGASWTHSGSTR